jgi:hypothetical protein
MAKRTGPSAASAVFEIRPAKRPSRTVSVFIASGVRC